ncbi:MAG: hypothetical protein NC911_06890, partial [Candidatus Omnitrophica bacterium]|nr:hypothetical protein [Candidatus Omnitrophota bacterium]
MRKNLALAFKILFLLTSFLFSQQLRIIDLAPKGSSNTPFDILEVEFNQEINQSTFTVEDIVFTGPGGNIGPANIIKISGTKYQIISTGQTGLQNYTLEIGPDIENMQGTKMDVSFKAGLFGTLKTIDEANADYENFAIICYKSTLTINGSHNFYLLKLLDNSVCTHSPCTDSSVYMIDLNIS